MLEDVRLMGCDESAVLLFIGLVLNADDYGINPAHPGLVTSRVWKLGQHSASETGVWIADLEREGFLIRFNSHGSDHLALRTWFKWQTLSHPRPLSVDVPSEVIAAMAESTPDPTRVHGAFSAEFQASLRARKPPVATPHKRGRRNPVTQLRPVDNGGGFGSRTATFD